ncbi:acyl transferase domain-containing protein [Saccharothrix tamanrassetensis]|uniref:Acyl transferase domain-containing protein n=1 Tax=Saccharothrix tamanrassetensis TaxID=1051531 RepID=A0A841CP87_9PSEU|nr:hypothetical protein [Saccharothrix tamanrassetensis]MBB5957326.1 acyl transferase domain-containing protein [Saccharothrix tamanrassetensis]
MTPGTARWSVLGLGVHTAGFAALDAFEHALSEGTADIVGTVDDRDKAGVLAVEQAVGDATGVPVIPVDRVIAALDRVRDDGAVLCASGDFGAVALHVAPGARPDAYAILEAAPTGAAATPELSAGVGGEPVAVVRAVLCLHHHHLPSARGGMRLWIGSRRTAVVGDVLLSATARPVRTSWHRATSLALLPVCGRDAADLGRTLVGIRDAVAAGADVVDLARRRAGDLPSARLRAVLCVTPATVARELDRAASTLPAVVGGGADWSTPAGSFCATAPIGPDRGVALVYPGMFSSYAGGSRELLRCFPDLIPGLDAVTDDSARYRPEHEAVGLLEGEDTDDVLARTLAAQFSGAAQTEALRGLLPGSRFGALGYSLGEISMAVATGRRSWRAPDLGQALDVVASYQAPDPRSWGSRVVLATADDVRRLLPRFAGVHLTHVNTPEEVVIAGDPRRCRALADELGRPSIATARSHLFHTPLFDSHRMAPLFRGDDGAGWGAEVFTGLRARLLDGPIRDDLLDGLRSTLDFPRLVRAAYVRGYRYFIEVGAGGTTSTWIASTLRGRPHVAESVERRGAAGAAGAARLFARLISHGAPIDPTPFLPTHREHP